MEQRPFRRPLLGPDARGPRGCRHEKELTERTLYVPGLNYYRLSQHVSMFRLRYRLETEQCLPQEVAARLRTLASAINRIQLATDVQTERVRLHNALIEMQDALETFERSALPEPPLLVHIQRDLVRSSHALAPDKG